MKIRNKLEKWIVLLTCFALLLGMMPVSALAAEQVVEQSNSDVVSSVPETYSNEIENKMPYVYGEKKTSYLKETAGGGYQTVVFDSGVLYIENFDSDWNIVETKNVALELPIFGGVFLGEQYNYVVCGQNRNTELDDGGEVYRVIKYNKQFQRLDSISFTSSETYTTIPFECGNVSIDEYGNKLTVYTSRQRLDGHQSNIALRINTSDMTVANSYGMTSFPDIHAGHSFRQIVKYDKDSVLYVDLSDGSPIRSVLIQYANKTVPLIEISGSFGDNVTDAEVSGVEISDSHYFVVGTYLHNEEQNVYLSCINKETAEVTTRWLTTSSVFSPQTIYAPQITKITEDRFAIMWNVARNHSVQYVIMDDMGNILCKQKEEYGIQLTDCKPIFSNGKIIWLSISDGIIRTEGLKDFSEVGSFEVVSPFVEPVNPWDGTSDTSWFDEEKTVFSISTPQQLAGLSELVSEGNTFYGKTVNLENDIFMNDDTYTYDWPCISTWEGLFNGNGHTIYNIFQEDEGGGLFQTVEENGIVKALTLAQGIFCAGGCIADLNQGIIAFCDSRSMVYDDSYSRRICNGAICDDNKNLVYGCKNYGKMVGESVAGIVGMNSESLSVVSQCSNWGMVSGIHEAGGIVGYNYGWVYNNYSKGIVSNMIPGNPNNGREVAGIVSYQASYGAGKIESCYNIGYMSCNRSYKDVAEYAIAPSGIVNGYSLVSGSNDESQISVLTADEMRSAAFVDLLNQQTNTVLPAWVMDTEQINDGYPITVADYNNHRGVYKIQPELWLNLNKVVSLKPGDSISKSCDCYYNEEDAIFTVEDSTIASVAMDNGKLKITAEQSGETYLNIHFNETENVIEADYQVKIVVDPFSGFCGNHATWSFDEATGTLAIEGTGSMYSYLSSASSDAPWHDYCDKICAVQIDDTITYIGNYAFYQCSELTDVVIPKGVTGIGNDAFNRCTKLKNITFEGGAPRIGSNAFYQVTATANYPANDLTWTEDIRQDYGGNLTWAAYIVEVDKGKSGELSWLLTEDGTLTFSGEGAMKNYTYKSEMPWYSYLDQIKAVVIEEGVTSIGSYAFYGMTNLTGITIPEGVTDIGAYAFKNCTALDNVVLPGMLTKLGESAFYGCTSLSAIEIPEGIYTIWAYTFKNCSSLAEVILPSTLIKIDEAAFYGCSALTEMEISDNVAIIGVYCFKNCTGLAKVKLPAKLTEVREAAFYGTALTGLDIPEGVTKVGAYAFKNCTSLAEIHLPETLTSIGESAFYGSTVAELVIPDAVTSIGSYAFKNCVKLANVQLPSGLTAVSEAAFYNCSSLTDLVLPDNVTVIGSYAFRNCVNLTSVTFGSGLKEIGESSFYGSAKLTDLVIPEGVTSIGAYAFKSCVGLTSVTLPDTLTTIGESAFYGCTGLAEIEIPVNVTSIEDYAFSRCTELETITFTGDAPIIGNSTFAKVTATVHYPVDNETWISSVMQNYGGTLTWTEG